MGTKQLAGEQRIQCGYTGQRMMDIPDKGLVTLLGLTNNSKHAHRLFAKVTFNIFSL